MRIYVDADACPVKIEILEIAKKYSIPITMVFDTSHIYQDNYSEIITVDKFIDSVDFKIINKCNKGDIVVTQDYGLATMCIARDVLAINQNGLIFTNTNIDKMLFERYINKKLRRQGIYKSKNKKRTQLDNNNFKNIFENMIKDILNIKKT